MEFILVAALTLAVVSAANILLIALDEMGD